MTTTSTKDATVNGTPTSRQDAVAEIVRAAAELFMEFGFSATTIDAVAERLGATKGLIYHYYDSKFDLYFDVQRAAMDKLISEVEPLARGAGDPMDKLQRMATRHIEILLKDLPIHKVAVQGLERHLLSTAPSRHAKALRAVIRLRDDYEQMFAEVIDQGIRAGVFVDLPPRLATKPFFGTLNWATTWYTPRRLQNERDIEELVEVLVSFAVRGMLKGDAKCATRPQARSRPKFGTK